MVTYLQNWKNAHQLEILIFGIVVILFFGIALKQKCPEKQYKRYGIISSFLYVVIVFYATILSRESNKVFTHNHKIFWSYKLALKDTAYLSEIGLNILLFVPLGIFWASLLEKRKKCLYVVIIVVGGSISACIEILQYNLKCGFSEVDDVISNLLGIVIGIVMW